MNTSRHCLALLGLILAAADADAQTPKREPVSPRFQREFLHPHTKGVLGSMAYSPDGKRLIAGDYPGGIVIVYDAATGKQLTKIETGSSHSSTHYFFVTPDWRTLYAAQTRRTLENINLDGVPEKQWVYSGLVGAWDLETGTMREKFQHAPPRGIAVLKMSPDGTKLLTGERRSGLWTAAAPATSLWDVATKKAQPLPKGFDWHSVFSGDSKRLAVVSTDREKPARTILILDTATLKPVQSIPFPEESQEVHPAAMDARTLVGSSLTKLDLVPGANPNLHPWTGAVVLWDIATGHQIATIAAEEKHTGYSYFVAGPDGRSLAVATWRMKQAKLLIIDLAARKLLHRIVLGDHVTVREPAFSADGAWVAVATQVFSDDLGNDVNVGDLEQPRVHLIEVATGKVRETLVLPHGITAACCFSPDGRTLAAGGHGRVLLFDLTRPPALTPARRE